MFISLDDGTVIIDVSNIKYVLDKIRSQGSLVYLYSDAEPLSVLASSVEILETIKNTKKAESESRRFKYCQ